MSSSDRSGPQRPRPAIPPAIAPRQTARDEPANPVAIPTPPGPTAHDLRRMVTEAALRADAALQQRERIRSARTRAEVVASRARTWMQELTRHLFHRSQHDAARSHADAVRVAKAQVAQASQWREHTATRLATGLQRVASTTSLANRVRALVTSVRAQPASPGSGDLLRLKHTVSDARHHRSWIGEQMEGVRRRMQRCQKVAASITSLLVIGRQQAENRTALIAADQSLVADHQTRVQEVEMAMAHARAPVLPAKHNLDRQQATAAHLYEAIDGIRTSGFGAYLSRASNTARALIQSAHAEAQTDGAKKAGRPPGRGADDDTQLRAARAAAAQARRSAPSTSLSTATAPAPPVVQPQVTLPAAVKAIDPAVSGSQPLRRNHDEAMANLPAHHALRYAERLQESRRIGYAAAVSDAKAGTIPVGSCNLDYRPAHMPFEVKNGACLIAVRGGDAIQFATSMDASSTAMEDWLGEPAIRRNLFLGGKARLKHVAGQIIAAWSPELHDLAVRGDLDVALAHQVDQLIARFGLQGHRVAAYLHIDSASGHPHLHLNFARVRDSDLSLWSLEGRQRAAALWVHARSNTVRLRGAAALADDIDALGATSSAARAAELLMMADNLSATRSLLTGHEERISLQGSAAAQRVTAVGSYHNALGGGLWKFGLGENPEDIRRWIDEVRQATKTGNAQRLAALHNSRPKVRGYWLEAAKTGEGRYELRYREGYGPYVARTSAARCRTSA